MLIGLLVGDEKGEGCLENNLDIKPESPVLNIPYVFLYALFHLPQFLGLATASVDLRISCNAGTAEVAHHIFVDDVAILFGVGKHMRPRTNDAHVAYEHIEELGKLVDIGLSDEIAKGEFPWVVFGGLQAVGFGIDMHRPEFQAGERFAIMAGAVLFEEDWSWALSLDAPCDNGDERQKDDAHHKAHHDVESALDKLVEWLRQRLMVVGEHHCLAQLLGLEVE